MIVGPATIPSKPNTSIPPNTLTKSNNSFNLVRFRSSTGRTILSATPATPPQIVTITTAFPQCPFSPIQIAAGTQISADPTTGTSEKNAISTAQKSGDEIPTSVNASPPSAPCIAAITKATATLAKISSCDSSSISV